MGDPKLVAIWLLTFSIVAICAVQKSTGIQTCSGNILQFCDCFYYPFLTVRCSHKTLKEYPDFGSIQVNFVTSFWCWTNWKWTNIDTIHDKSVCVHCSCTRLNYSFYIFPRPTMADFRFPLCFAWNHNWVVLFLIRKLNNKADWMNRIFNCISEKQHFQFNQTPKFNFKIYF